MLCRVFSKIILFQEALQFQKAIVLFECKQTTMKVIGHMPRPITWHIVKCFFLVVITYVLNQFCGRWLHSDQSCILP
jgi:hypothetical protein